MRLAAWLGLGTDTHSKESETEAHLDAAVVRLEHLTKQLERVVNDVRAEEDRDGA